MDINAAATAIPSPRTAFEPLDGAPRRLPVAEANGETEASPAHMARKAQHLDVRV